MRILIINQPYWPDVVSTAQHMRDWATHMAAHGHEVTVIASRSVYGQQGAVLPKNQTHEGVRICRVGSNLFRKGRTLTRLVDFGLFHMRALGKALTMPRQDVVVCLTTPPFIGVVGMMVKAIRGSRFIQFEMDLYPDIAIALETIKPGSLAARFFERIHRRILRSADRVIVLGRCMRRVIEDKGIGADKLRLVTPWADPEEVRPIPHEQNAFRAAHGWQGRLVVMYAGNLGLGHDTQTLLRAMEQLKDDPRLRFVFVGGGKRMAEIRAAMETKKLANVELMEYVPREQLGEMLAAADVHLITQGMGTTGLIVPSKLYGILAAGRPTVYLGPVDSEIALTLEEGNAGKAIAVGDVQGLISAIRAFERPADEVAALARAALERGHTRAQCVVRLTQIAEEIAK
jgi:glycosyltransferase involved in cell wall biosynthesis